MLGNPFFLIHMQLNNIYLKVKRRKVWGDHQEKKTGVRFLEEGPKGEL